MHAPLLTFIIIIFVIWLQYEIRKTNRKAQKDLEHFWDRENKSNLTRRGDISKIDYININTNYLPVDNKDDDTINSYRDTILSLSNQKIINLSGITNTELKNMYGAANLNILSEYDNNFTILVSILQKWAERLYSKGYTQDALRVLEYAVTCKTDVAKSYKLLGELYLKQKAPEKIYELISALETLQIQERDKLILFLKEMIHS